MGKVAEHAILNRLSQYLEEHEVYPHTMIGFRPGLFTQDAMLLLKNQIISHKTRDTRAILGLDMEKAFDNILHTFILETISNLGLGSHFHQYVEAFPSGRMATLKAGDLTSDTMKLGNRGTPQGAVISPTLFNISMIGLARRLEGIEGIEYTLYADDVTIWCTGGSDGEIEQRLQEAVNVTEEYLIPTGLRCSPYKSELLLY